MESKTPSFSLNRLTRSCLALGQNLFLSLFFTYCFEEVLTAKSKVLNAHQDNTHSVHSRSSSDKDFLDRLEKKHPIAWPKMSDTDGWSKLDSAVYSRLVGVSSIQDKVELLENLIYDQASLLFGHPILSKKGSKGLNRRARMSINLCMEKNSLVARCHHLKLFQS